MRTSRATYELHSPIDTCTSKQGKYEDEILVRRHQGVIITYYSTNHCGCQRHVRLTSKWCLWSRAERRWESKQRVRNRMCFERKTRANIEKYCFHLKWRISKTFILLFLNIFVPVTISLFYFFYLIYFILTIIKHSNKMLENDKLFLSCTFVPFFLGKTKCNSDAVTIEAFLARAFAHLWKTSTVPITSKLSTPSGWV